MAKKLKNVEKIGVILPKLLETMGLKHEIEQHKALFIWNRVVGKTIAEHASPAWIKYGILFVTVDDAIWKQELEFLKSQILSKLNEHMDAGKLKGIKFIQESSNKQYYNGGKKNAKVKS